MGKIKNLANITLAAGALALGSMSCTADSSSRYDGKIGDDQVRYTPWILPLMNELIVIKPDGTKIRYADFRNISISPDHLDFIEISKEGRKSRYDFDDDKIGRSVVEEGQKQYDWYLEQIKKEGVKDIMGQESPKEEQKEHPIVEEE